MIFRAKAPLRISFCGGGTDCSPYTEERGGVVLSATIDKYAYASLSRSRTDRSVSPDEPRLRRDARVPARGRRCRSTANSTW